MIGIVESCHDIGRTGCCHTHGILPRSVDESGGLQHSNKL
jgi:hypothetical protein